MKIADMKPADLVEEYITLRDEKKVRKNVRGEMPGAVR